MKMKQMGKRMSAVTDVGSWTPRTEIGRMVKSGQITSIEQISDMGKPILESEIIDMLLPTLEYETLQMKTTQRVTENGRKIKFRVVVLVGDKNGHVGIGVGKCEEVRPAIESAVVDAKRNVISVEMGCGSWECVCGGKHSVPMETEGKYGSVTVTIKPAPRGLGLAANKVVRKILDNAGMKDVWSSTRGHTNNIYNTSQATIAALRNVKLQKATRPVS